MEWMSKLLLLFVFGYQGSNDVWCKFHNEGQNMSEDLTSTSSDQLQSNDINSGLLEDSPEKFNAKLLSRHRRYSYKSKTWRCIYGGFNCFHAKQYATYFQRKNVYEVKGKLRYFPDECCTTFEHQCYGRGDERRFQCPRRASANPIHGGWSKFGPCSKSCGGGTTQRTCTNPAPFGGGKQCTGSSTYSCNTKPCPRCPRGYVVKQRKRRNWEGDSTTNISETLMIGNDNIATSFPNPDYSFPLPKKLRNVPQMRNLRHRQRRSYVSKKCPSYAVWMYSCGRFYDWWKLGQGRKYFYVDGKRRAVDPLINHCCNYYKMMCNFSQRGIELQCYTESIIPIASWGSWYRWSICDTSDTTASINCENAKRTRERACFSSRANDRCSGSKYETEKCEVTLCGRLFSNNDVADICCFIIRSTSGNGQTYILTDHELSPSFEEKCGSSDSRCAYSPYDSVLKTIDTSKQICLKNLINTIGSKYVCCSRNSGAFCNSYGPKTTKHNVIPGLEKSEEWKELQYLQLGKDLSGDCPNDCKIIASCPNSGNEWCNSSKIESPEPDEIMPRTKPPPPPSDCSPMVEHDPNEEPVIQSAEYIPNVLKDAKFIGNGTYGRKKRSLKVCNAFNAWVFTCYQSVQYMLYSQKKSWYYIYWKDKWRFFKNGCCPEFQSKCWDHPKLKRHKEVAHCPKNY